MLSASAAVKRGDLAAARAQLETYLKSHPDAGAIHRDLAQICWRLGDAKAAVEHATEAIKRSGGADLDAKFMLATFFHELGQDGSAEPLIDAVVVSLPDAQQAWLLQGLVKLGRAKFDEATAIFTKLLDRDPTSIWARMSLGLLWWLDGKTEQARGTFEQLATEHPDMALAHFRLAAVLLEEDRTVDAVAALQRYVETAAPNRLPAMMQAAATLIRYGAAAQAIDWIHSTIKAQPDDAVPLRPLLADAYVREGRPDAAEVELQNIIASGATATAADGMLQLGRLYLAQHRPVEALAKFKDAARLAPKSLEPIAGELDTAIFSADESAAVAAAKTVLQARGVRGADADLFLGMVQERLHQPKKAEALYRGVLKQHPENTTAARYLARLYAKTGRAQDAQKTLDAAAPAPGTEATLVYLDRAWLAERAGRAKDAEAIYRELLARNRYHPVALNNLAFLLSENPGGLEEADALSHRAFRLLPDDPHVIDTRGWIAYQRQDLDAAVTNFRRAMALNPDDPQFHYHLGLAYVKQGKKPQARAELNEALANPEFLHGDDARAALASLQ